MAPRTNATTPSNGNITIRAALVGALSQEQSASAFEKWKKDLDLARLLVHEKTHAHYQSSGSPTFQANGHHASDWLDTAHAFRQDEGIKGNMTQEDMGGLLPGVNVESLWPKYKTTAVWRDAPVNNQNYTKLQLTRGLLLIAKMKYCDFKRYWKKTKVY